MKYRIEFRGRIQETAAGAVEARIGKARYDAIKTLEPHPCFIELCIAEVGESTGRVLGKGNVRKRWGKAVVQELTDGFKSASLFQAPDLYDGHDNANAKRRSVGKLFEGWMAGEKAMVFGVVTDADAAKAVASGERDTCSIEAAVEFDVMGDVWDVTKIHQKEGLAVALADSRRGARPGFDGSGVTAVIQELEDDEDKKKKGKPMTLAEIKVYCEEHGIRPDQLFSIETLLKVGAVNDLMKDVVKEAEEKAAETAKKLADDLKIAQDGGAALAAKLETYTVQERRQGARALVEKAPVMKDVPVGAVPYVVSKLSPETLKETDAEKLKTAIEAEAAKVMAEAKVLGIAFGAPAKGDGAGGGTGGHRETPGVITKENYRDPKVNRFLEQPAAK